MTQSNDGPGAFVESDTLSLLHELNQPLTAIANYASAARRTLDGVDAPQTAAARDMLEKLSGQIKRADEIIRRLRECVEKRELSIDERGDAV